MNKIQMMNINTSCEKLKEISDVQSVLLKLMVKRMKGRFFSATVVTEKGVRKFNATTNIKKFNKGILKRTAKENLVVVYDKYAGGVRTINLKNLTDLKCGNIKYNKDLSS